MRCDYTAYILAGGGSRRMGRDKLFVKIEGQSLLKRMINICENCFNQVKIAAPNLRKFSDFTNSVVPDFIGAEGPMAGVIAALEDCEQDCCFISAVDMPDLSVDLIRSLINQYQNEQYLGLMEPGGIQPLCGIYHKSSLETLYHFGTKKEYSMVKAVTALNYRSINVSTEKWRNINCPEDLRSGVVNG